MGCVHDDALPHHCCVSLGRRTRRSCGTFTTVGRCGKASGTDSSSPRSDGSWALTASDSCAPVSTTLPATMYQVPVTTYSKPQTVRDRDRAGWRMIPCSHAVCALLFVTLDPGQARPPWPRTCWTSSESSPPQASSRDTDRYGHALFTTPPPPPYLITGRQVDLFIRVVTAAGMPSSLPYPHPLPPPPPPPPPLT